MSVLNHSPSITREGLVLCLDAGAVRSYSGSGSNWDDIAGESFIRGGINGATFSAESGAGGTKSFSFDGSNDYVQHNENDVFSTQTSGSISVWFKTSYSGNYQYLISSGDDSAQTNQLGLAIYNAAGNSVLYFYAIANGGTYSLVEGPTSVADGNWHHAVVVSTGTAWKIYLDGVEEGLTVTNGSNNGTWFGDVANRNGFDIGRFRQPSPTYYFNGKITCVHIYNKALSATEIIQNYEAHKGRFGK